VTATYEAEARALEKDYWKQVGWALQYGIKVYHPGGQMKALGDLRDEVRRERDRREPQDRSYLPPPSREVQAYCRRGHKAMVWGGPMMAKPGEQVRWWGAPFLCHCGSEIFGGYPR
jgi:hypothetical protein